MKCKHRDYKAKRRPRVNCEACWRKYIEKHPEKWEPLIEDNAYWLAPQRPRFNDTGWWWNPSFEWW